MSGSAALPPGLLRVSDRRLPNDPQARHHPTHVDHRPCRVHDEASLEVVDQVVEKSRSDVEEDKGVDVRDGELGEVQGELTEGEERSSERASA
jgi:hypothetical protein